MKKIILNLALAASLIICFGGCDKEPEPGACKAGQGHVNESVFPLESEGITDYFPWHDEIVNPSDVYYMHVGSNVQFFIATRQLNICTKTHLKINYYVKTRDTTQSLPLRIFAEAFWGDYDELKTLNGGVITPGARFDYTMEIGLKQAFGEGPGDIEVFLTVEFPKQASLEEDIKYFKRHIHQISMSFDYDNHG